LNSGQIIAGAKLGYGQLGQPRLQTSGLDRSVIASDAFIAAWDNLSSNAAEPNVFNESWFLGPALRQFDPAHKSRMFTLWLGQPMQSELIGFIPLRQLKQYGRWPITHIQNWLHPNAFLGSPLVRAGYEQQFWAHLLPWLDDHLAKSGLFMHFNGLVIDGPLQRSLDMVCAEQGRMAALVHQEDRAFLSGNEPPDVYYTNAVRGKKRKELRRQHSRLAELGTLTFHRDQTGEGLPAWTGEFLALERRGWKGANGSALDCAPQTRMLFQDTLDRAAKQSKLERLDLRLNGRPIAMLVNFVAKPGSFSFKTAYDEDYARFSPGVLLQIENLALLTRENIDWCDSCAAQGHPMIDSLWTGRRSIGRYSVAIGSGWRRKMFHMILRAELKRMAKHGLSKNVSIEQIAIEEGASI
jgi:hypothetical protein